MELKHLSKITLESCQFDNEVIKDYLKECSANYSKYLQNL